MSLPFGHEEISKLKMFAEFVSNNPTILNLPQLDFMKILVEKFGGTVPPGEFKMPAGGKCPFSGGAAKTEAPKFEPEPEVEEEDMDSAESEVELDMDVAFDEDESESESSDNDIATHSVYLRQKAKLKQPAKKQKSKNSKKACKAPLKKETKVAITEAATTIEAVTLEEKAPMKQPPASIISNTDGKSRRSKGKLHVPAAKACEEKCRYKCLSHFTEEERQLICNTFWSMDYKRRKDFVLARVEQQQVSTPEKRKLLVKRKRKVLNRFFFKGEKGENVRVCKKFFTTTLCVGHTFLEYAQKNADKRTGAFVGEDMRGKNTPRVNKIPDEMLEEVRRHIESYPTWVPRKNYKTRYLHSSLTIRQMWREYSQPLIEQQRKYVSDMMFRKVFHKEYRLAFLKPKSKNEHKVSPQRKRQRKTAPAEAQKTAEAAAIKVETQTNKNISDFTGDEGGGFWLQPANANYTLMPCAYTQNVAATTTTTFVNSATAQPAEIMYLSAPQMQTTHTPHALAPAAAQTRTHFPQAHNENFMNDFHHL